MITYPQGTYLLIFTQLWERFSFYGMRTLLVLFMIQQLQYDNAAAIGIYALYATLVNLGGLVGGYCGDRILGLRTAVFFGGILIGIGHLCLTLESQPLLIYLGLSFIIVGSAFFVANLKALFGFLFSVGDKRRDSGYTLYYTGINCGGFIAAIACGFVAQMYGWNAGFGLAALGMFLGLCLLYKSRHLLLNKGDAPEGISVYKKGICVAGSLLMVFACMLLLQSYELVTPILSPLGILMVGYILYGLRNHAAFKRILSLCGFIGLFVLFFMVEDLMGSLLIIFCENKVNRLIGGIEIPSTALVAMNPLTVIVFGTLFTLVVSRFSTQQAQGMLKTNSIAFVLLGTAFGFLAFGTQFTADAGLVPLSYVLLSFMLIAFGELFIAPTLYSYCSSTTPLALQGQMMGLLTVGRSYASLLSGMLGQAVVNTQTQGESNLFAITAIVSIAIAGCLALIYVVNRWRKVFA